MPNYRIAQYRRLWLLKVLLKQSSLLQSIHLFLLLNTSVQDEIYCGRCKLSLESCHYSGVYSCQLQDSCFSYFKCCDPALQSAVSWSDSACRGHYVSPSLWFKLPLLTSDQQHSAQDPCSDSPVPYTDSYCREASVLLSVCANKTASHCPQTDVFYL